MSTIRIMGCVLLLIAATGCRSPDTPASATTSPPSAAEMLAAVDSGDPAVIHQLIARGAKLDASVRGDGTALILASRQGKLEIVDQLLQAGAGVDVASPGDGNPLIMAAKAGHTNVVRRLTEAGADPNAVVAGDETPLINAARGGHLGIVEFLVEHGADVNLAVTLSTTQVRTPLNQASNASIRSYLVGRGAKE